VKILLEVWTRSRRRKFHMLYNINDRSAFDGKQIQVLGRLRAWHTADTPSSLFPAESGKPYFLCGMCGAAAATNRIFR
jgi:hypothetical protein